MLEEFWKKSRGCSEKEGKVNQHGIVLCFVLRLYFEVGSACRGFYQAYFRVMARVDKWYVSSFVPSQPHIWLYCHFRILVMVLLNDLFEWRFGRF